MACGRGVEWQIDCDGLGGLGHRVLKVRREMGRKIGAVRSRGVQVPVASPNTQHVMALVRLAFVTASVEIRGWRGPRGRRT